MRRVVSRSLISLISLLLCAAVPALATDCTGTSSPIICSASANTTLTTPSNFSSLVSVQVIGAGTNGDTGGGGGGGGAAYARITSGTFAPSTSYTIQVGARNGGTTAPSSSSIGGSSNTGLRDGTGNWVVAACGAQAATSSTGGPGGVGSGCSIGSTLSSGGSGANQATAAGGGGAGGPSGAGGAGNTSGVGGAGDNGTGGAGGSNNQDGSAGTELAGGVGAGGGGGGSGAGGKYGGGGGNQGGQASQTGVLIFSYSTGSGATKPFTLIPGKIP